MCCGKTNCKNPKTMKKTPKRVTKKSPKAKVTKKSPKAKAMKKSPKTMKIKKSPKAMKKTPKRVVRKTPKSAVRKSTKRVYRRYGFGMKEKEEIAVKIIDLLNFIHLDFDYRQFPIIYVSTIIEELNDATKNLNKVIDASDANRTLNFDIRTERTLEKILTKLIAVPTEEHLARLYQYLLRTGGKSGSINKRIDTDGDGKLKTIREIVRSKYKDQIIKNFFPMGVLNVLDPSWIMWEQDKRQESETFNKTVKRFDNMLANVSISK